MIPIKKILVPTDLSEAAKRAATYGFAFARQFQANLLIAHVVPESTALLYTFPTETFAIDRELAAKAKQEIDNLVAAEHADDVQTGTIVKMGHIESELLGIVKEEAIDLVIMGTHGRHNLGRWFLGSVTERLLRRLPVPVLTVSHVETEKLLAPASFKRILYATGLDEAEPGLDYAIELARGTGAELTVLHVADSMDRLLWGPTLLARLEGERSKLVRELKSHVDDLIARNKQKYSKIEGVVAEGKPFEKILELATHRNTDIIVINLKGKTILDRAFIGSTAERVVRLATIPVISIPVAHTESTRESK